MIKKVAVLWDSEIKNWGSRKPLGEKASNTYEFFSKIAQKQGIELLIANYREYQNGSVKKSWVWEEGSWKKRKNEEIDLVFDKFKLNDETLKLKKQIKEDVGILNHPKLDELCKDKLKSYQKFSEYTPETRKASRENVKEMIDKYGAAVIKPRYSFGGKGVKKLESIEEYDEDIETEEYVVQRYINSSEGIDGLVDGSHDLRAIISDGEIRIAYLRYNQDGFVSNVAAGGDKEKVDLDEFPEKGRELVETVKDKIQSDFSASNYSVDLFSDQENRPWIIELNSKPGMNFEVKGRVDKELKKDSQKLMNAILEIFEKKTS